MDAEEQAKQDFLDEATDYCNQLESSLLGLADANTVDLEKLQQAARAAHSIKGGAAMMGFNALSQTAHSLEDFLKILQARYKNHSVAIKVETLLLKAVDCLRNMGEQYRAGSEPQQEWLDEQTSAIFTPLKEQLGELTEADETALLSKEEETDVADILFGSGVEESLERLKQQLELLPPSELAQQLQTTTEELAEFGRMIECDAFVSICDSVKHYLGEVTPEQVPSLTRSAIGQWERCQALIQLGRYDNLPTAIDPNEITAEDINAEELEIPDIDEIDSGELTELQEEIETIDFAEESSEEVAELTDQEESSPISDESESEPSQAETQQESETVSPQQSQAEETTVRVSVEQLTRINTLFSRLILEREVINSRLKQLQDYVNLSKTRTQQLEQANAQLRKWYDQLNLEQVGNQIPTENQDASNQAFDPLEMDRYSSLHLLFQEHMETIVQLQEVTSDIEVSSREINQAMGELNFTTSDLQRSITRVQTRPFIEAVRSFRRVIRDLSVEYDKPVALEIQGENTLIDRAAMEALSAPLNHLVRNAFDHGIEDLETRMQRGKPKQGQITLRAVNQGNKSVISISDDGGGINLDKIKHRLEKFGTPQEALNELSNQELIQAIFEPGFSTAEQVTELSGRGVGMDVVHTNLEKIRGEINVDTQPGEGTTFYISFPISVSIARVTIVESSGVIFAVPVESVKAFVRFDSDSDSGEVTWNNTTIPVTGLEQWSQFNRPAKPFEMEGTPTLARPTALIVDYNGSWHGLRIDRFWQEQEVALRSVDSPFPLPPGVTGSTVLGDGRPIPLVDPVPLLSWLHQPESTVESRVEWDQQPSFTGNTILIVDDSIHVRRYLAIALEKAGYQVEQAKDGQEAVDKIFSGLSVQAVICDIEMPRLDGYGVLGEVKGHPEFKELPIAMLTSRGNEKHRQLAMKLGASAYFSKPYNEQELLTTLEEMMQTVSYPTEMAH